VAALLAVLGLVLGVEEFVLVAGAGVSLVVAGEATVLVQARWARSALVVAIEVPRREVMAGDDGEVALVVHNRGRRTSGVFVVEEAPPWHVSYPGLLGAKRTSPSLRPLRLGTGQGPRAPGMLRSRQLRWRLGPLGPGARVTVPVALPAARRGLWTLGSLRLWCCDAFGLVAAPVARSPEAEVVVVPRPAWRSVAASGSTVPAVPGHLPGGDAEHAVAPGGDEFAGLRPYVAGDRLTRLHWPVLARSGDLVVRDFVEPMAGVVEVRIDDRPAQLEESVARAAAEALDVLRSRAGVVLRTGAGERLVVSPGPMATTAVLRALGTVGAAT
jgi:uncharacterized protein (DUF58 family)